MARYLTEKDTPAWKLFHYKFQCRIPEMAIYNDVITENIGIMVSGDAKKDKIHAGNMADVIRTAPELAELHSKGIPIEIPESSDCLEMYELIAAHIEATIEHSKTNAFGKPPPMEDLKKLDTFASHIHGVARHHFVNKELKVSKLMDFFQKASPKAKVKNEKTASEGHESKLNKLNSARHHSGRGGVTSSRPFNGKRRW